MSISLFFKIKGPNGPGHVPPHIGLAALTRYDHRDLLKAFWEFVFTLSIHFSTIDLSQKTSRAYHDGGFGSPETWFDHAQNGCRVLPSVLLTMIRNYFPRSEDGSVKYPPPFTTDGGPGGNGMTYPYPLEYGNLVGEYA